MSMLNVLTRSTSAASQFRALAPLPHSSPRTSGQAPDPPTAQLSRIPLLAVRVYQLKGVGSCATELQDLWRTRIYSLATETCPYGTESSKCSSACQYSDTLGFYVTTIDLGHACT